MSQKATDLIQHNQLRICHQFYCVMLIMRKPFKLNTINPNYNDVNRWNNLIWITYGGLPANTDNSWTHFS